MQNLNKEEVDKKVAKFKQSLEQRLEQEYKEKLEGISEEKKQEEIYLTEIFSVKYYDVLSLKTKFNNILLHQEDVYIVEFVNGENTTYEIYFKDTNHKIAQIDIEGKIIFEDEKLDNNTTLAEIEENNNEKESLEYNKEELEELEEQKEEKNVEEAEQEKNTDISEEREEEIFEDTEKSTELLEEELKLDKGDIRSCTKIKLTGKDNVFRKHVPECREFDEVKLVYISSEDHYRFVGLKHGQPPKFLESIEPSQSTGKRGMNIDDTTGNVENENLQRVMKFTNSKDYDFSVKIGQYGYIELNMLRKDPVTNKYISTKVETTTQRPQEKSKEINELMDKNKNKRINEEIDRFEEEKNEEGKDAKLNLYDISDKTAEKKEEIEKKEDEHERTLDENVKKYYY